jgi:hypothetical protein
MLLLPKKITLDHKCASKGVFLMVLEDDDDPSWVYPCMHSWVLLARIRCNF